jgi:hypothetical protein
MVVWIATTSCAPKAGTANRRGQEGTGHSPEQAALGIRKGATPALQSQVGRLTAWLPSIELARDDRARKAPPSLRIRSTAWPASWGPRSSRRAPASLSLR